jgi:hypothetical protein
MEGQSHTLESEQRQALIGHITRHLADLDDQTLLSLADLTREAALDVETVDVAGSPVTRRRFLTATLAGGFIAATAGAVAVWQYGSGRGKELNDEVARLWGLVRLHEKLDDVGLDSVAAAGLAAVGAALDALAGASELVKAGAQTVEDALKKIEVAFPTIRAGVVWLEGLVSDLSQRVHLLEDAIGRTLNEVNPITQALGAFFDAILNAIPLGGGQNIREALDRIGDIINSIPKAIADINVQILTPLRDDWFSDDPGKGLKGGLIEPIITKLLDPLEAMTGQLGELLRHWEGDLSMPVKTALGKREAVRQEIADYKAHYRLESPPSSMVSG